MAEEKRVIELLNEPEFGSTVEVKGWVRTKRDTKGGFSFVELNDGSCQKNIQIIVEQTAEGAENLPQISTSACISVEGVVAESPGREQSCEIKAGKIKVFGFSDPSFPIQKKRHTLEYLRTVPHLRVRTNLFGSVFRVRHAISYAIHKFFNERNYLWVHTPIITSNDAEGAGDMFQVTTLDLNNIPKVDGEVDFDDDFFGKPVFLTVSGQLAVEAYCNCFKGVYTFGPTFRSENSNTARHLSEFWMIEPEVAFADLKDNFMLAQEFLKYIFAYVLEKNADDMQFFDKRVLPGIISTLEHVINSPFEMIDYTEAVEILEKCGKKFEYPVYWGCNLQAEHERYLTEEKIGKPVAVVNYPKEIKAFYMYLNDDEKTVAAMDVLVPRIGELIGGSQREHRPEVLEKRLVECGMSVEDYQWYLDLRRWGTVPHSGFGIGFERAVQYITGVSNIRDVIPYPRAPKQALF